MNTSVPNRSAIRRCLRCGKDFRSDSPSNRVCRSCKRLTRPLQGGVDSFDMDNCRPLRPRKLA